MFNILGQLLTAVSYIIYWVSRFFKAKKSMLIADNLSRLIAIIAFICLDSINAIQNTVFCIVRNYLGTKVINSKRRIKIIVLILLFSCAMTMYVLSFKGIETVFIAICSTINMFGVIMLKEQGMRLATLSGSGFYASYLFLTANYTGFICELITLIVSFISWLKYHNKKEVLVNNIS